MRVCPFCDSLVPAGEERCIFCAKRLPEDLSAAPRYSSDARSFPRVSIEEKIFFDLLQSSPQGTNLKRTAILKDLSIAGLYFETDQAKDLAQSDIIWISFELPDWPRPLRFHGEVRRIKQISETKTGIGVMFLCIEENEKRALKKFIHTKLSLNLSRSHKP